MNAIKTLTKEQQYEEDENPVTPFVYPYPESRDAPAYVTWTQRNGTTIQIRHMDDRHLFNTIRMLERVAEKKASEEKAFVNYEWFLPPVYAKLVKAAESRGIDLEYREPEEERLAALERWKQFQRKNRLARAGVIK